VEYFQVLCANAFSDFDIQDRYGATALHRAAMWGTAEDVQTLLQLGASPTLTDEQVWTPAFCAASMNNVATLKRLAENIPHEFLHAVDFRGRTIFHVAIEAGGLEMMRLVLELGADPHRVARIASQDRKTTYKMTLVEFAMMKGPQTYHTFIDALQLAGFDVSTLDDGPHRHGLLAC
jgi:ankyrin repeat protein